MDLILILSNRKSVWNWACTCDSIRNLSNSDFICVYGDLLFKEDFIVSLLSKFNSSDSIATMALTESDTPKEFFGSV